MTEIIPAILPKSYEEFAEKLEKAAGHVKCVQIDICDGKYVENRTWPYVETGKDQIFQSLVGQKKALPHWEEIDFEFDLMVFDAYEKIPDFISAGAGRIIVHRASVGEDELAAIVKDYGRRSEETGLFDVELGIALRPSDSPALIKEIAPHIHFVQVMGISNIGFQGQSFDERAVDLVRTLRETYPSMPLSADGGIDLNSARLLARAGADRLVVGSYLFNSKDFSGTLEALGSL